MKKVSNMFEIVNKYIGTTDEEFKIKINQIVKKLCNNEISLMKCHDFKKEENMN